MSNGSLKEKEDEADQKRTLQRQYDRDLKEANISLTPKWEDITAAAQLCDE